MLIKNILLYSTIFLSFAVQAMEKNTGNPLTGNSLIESLENSAEEFFKKSTNKSNEEKSTPFFKMPGSNGFESTYKKCNLSKERDLIQVFSFKAQRVEKLLLYIDMHNKKKHVRELTKQAKEGDIVCSYALWEYYTKHINKLKKPKKLNIMNCLMKGVKSYYPPAQLEYGKILLSKGNEQGGLFFINAAAQGGLIVTIDPKGGSDSKFFYYLPAVTYLTDYYLSRYPDLPCGWLWHAFEKELQKVE